MGLVGGIVLLIIGLALVFVARQRADGGAILPIKPPLDMVYPAFCLIFLAFGAAYIITNL